ncbi:MAG: phosphate ABC transporter substrate-binding protein [Desulfurivibrionaceae bacterium]|jgi:phosphate transport system substrate-binding protein|nr:phosphate ABC transporter substrate-binding protein [Pseudomonadota bacterium]MCG2824731.1 phosphate ABC transporter substrate-binding protein [Desulfobulbaceae bacterium]MDP2756136.1 phosphate ABC transporter substrate-binding protein [Desulfurivibrionaceae bacterium]
MKKVALTLGLLLAAAITGCDSGPSQQSAPVQTLSIKGSDTMVHLVSSWTEEFMKAHADIDISVTGGGSGTGIAALINGTTDICAASRGMKEKEQKQAEQKKISPVEIPVARDGIVLIVHPQNPVNGLTIDQLRLIYTGKATNWKEVGGSDTPILLLSRESSSGTFVFFQEHVLNKEDFSSSARLLPGTSALVQAVAADRGAIAYVGLGFAAEAKTTVKTLGVQAADQPAPVLPSEETVRSGAYAVSRPLFFYTNGTPTKTAQQFIDFCLSPAGQQIVRETGYVPVS